jgi:hypothetical protein
MWHLAACAQMGEAYVSIGRSRDLYIVVFILGGSLELVLMSGVMSLSWPCAFLRTVLMCCANVSFGSSVTPRYVAWVDQGIGVPFCVSGGGGFVNSEVLLL